MENWCEYTSQDGEIRNVLQFFCECEDLDQSFTNLVSPPQEAKDSGRRGWQRVVVVAQDRARVPWPGGARRVDLAWPFAALLLRMLLWQARRSKTLVEVVIMMIVCFGGLGYSHVRALRQGSNSQFHVAWLSLSLLGSYWRYRDVIGHTVPWTTSVIAHACFLAMVASYLQCCMGDPGRDTLANVSGVSTVNEFLTEDAMNDQRQRRARILRSGRCRICRHTFRLRDHHCVWVGQCIAERNRRQFLAFLVLMSGLSFWFSSKMTLVSSSGRPSSGQSLWRGDFAAGEDAAHTLYALIAGSVALALALQQTLLVGAGVTSLELRKAGCTPYNPKEKRRSTDRSLDRSAQSKNSLPPLNGAGRRRGLVLFPSRREFFGNWADFLRGNEVSSTA